MYNLILSFISRIETLKNGKTQYAILALICASFFTLSSCKCDDPADPACRNYDPCYEQEATSAEFEMFELITGDTFLVTTGKLLYTRTLLLIASQEDASEYTWRIGSDTTLRKGKEIIVTFGQAYGKIPITLIVKKETDMTCFPQDDGVDTTQQVIDLIWIYELPTWGKYKGFYEDTPGTSFEVDIRLDTIFNGGLQEYFNMYNFPKGCPKMQLLRMGANGVIFPRDGGVNSTCLFSWGAAQLTSPDSISITMHVKEREQTANNNLLTRTFIGIRQ